MLRLALLASAAGVPACNASLLAGVEGWLVDLDGTMYGDTRPGSDMGFIDGAADFHRAVQDEPLVYLSNSAAKGAAGVDAKFKRLGWTTGIAPAAAFTAADGIAELVTSTAGPNARLYLLESASEADSCLRVLRRHPKFDATWQIALSLTDAEAKAWAAAAANGTQVLVIVCSDGEPHAASDGGPDRLEWQSLAHAFWLLRNAKNGTLVGQSPDDFNANKDAEYPALRLETPGPGGLIAFLATGSERPPAAPAQVVGKGGDAAPAFMFAPAKRLLEHKAARQLDFAKLAMVGDTLNTDVMGGNSVGAVTVFLTASGVHSLADLPTFPDARPTCHLPSIKELTELLPRSRAAYV